MKVILLKDVAKAGRKDEVREVSGGYARNFLLPQRLAEPATDTTLAALAAKKSVAAREKTKEYEKHKAAVEKLKGLVLHLKIKVGEKGRAFGSVTAQKIADEMTRRGIHAQRDWVLLDEPIKTTGERVVPVKFPHEILAHINVIIESESA